ncbi:MAG TPA: hypothetical protein PKD51_06440 [Saprospiraceae bacterium]|nr:hypothetical protein [Saprospiraceae bacterium]
MSFRLLLICFLLVFGYSIIIAQNLELKNDEMVKHHFTDAEIKNFEKIIEYFEKYLRSNCHDVIIENCYTSYFKNLASFEDNGDLKIQIPKDLEMNMLKDFDDIFLNEIWIDWGRFNNEGRKENYLYYNMKGKYFRFLENLALKNDRIDYYLKGYKLLGDFSPTLIVGTIKDFENCNFNDPKEKLLIAIHQFSINRF